MTDVMSFADRMRGWARAAYAKLRRRSWTAALVVAGVGYVAIEVVRAWVSEAGTLLLVWAFHGLHWLARQPMGAGGIALVSVLLVLVVVSWWEARPRPDPPPPKREAIPENERRLIQEIRTIWNRKGRLAVPQLRDLLRDATSKLSNEVFWSELLWPVVTRLDHQITELENALAPEAGTRIAEVRERFNDMYQAYIQGMKWVAQLQAEDLFDPAEHDHGRVKVWQQNHRDLYERLQDLSEDPDHRGTMKIFLHWVDNPAFREFLRDAQTSPAWLALMREHEASQTEPQVE